MSIQPVTGIIAPPTQPISQADKIKIDNHIKAEQAKAKPKEERTTEDKVAIVTDTINNVLSYPQVAHANAGQKLNYLA